MKDIYNENTMIFKVLSDSNRIKIIEMLSCGEICACTILEKLNITQPTLSHHMKKLEESHLVYVRKEGLWSYYSLNKKQIANILTYLIKITYDS
ncbi:MAG: metalloregulator ArsR/SmtB family transcription factor [Clostridia bacterium]|nr:metalloregulator ArsR/SmtB family transcription factor [Clostridia bacterium]